jgi:cytochrome b558/566 subunit A
MPGQVQATRLLVVIAALGALLLATRDMLLAAPTAQLTAVQVASAAPTGPDDPVWGSAPVVDVPLTAQASLPPALAQASVVGAKLRAVHDGQTISFMVEWADPTRDVLTIGPNQFRDAAALQFGVGETLAAICMGTPVGLANLWHWKADWQEDIDKGFQDLTAQYPNFWKDYYPYVTAGAPPFNIVTDFTSDAAKAYLIGQAAGNPMSMMARATPVEELLAAGFGTATTKTTQNVAGKGVWQNGVWRVVFTRPLTVQDSAAPIFGVGKTLSIAVAVWNGDNREVGSRKQVSSFVTLAVDSTGVRLAPTPAAAVAKPAAPVAVTAAPAAPARPTSGDVAASGTRLFVGFVLGTIVILFAAILYITRRP